MLSRLLRYLLLGIIVTLLILFGVPLLQEPLRDHALGSDYTGFLLGSAMFRHGYTAAPALYDLARQTQVQQSLLHGSAVSFADGLLPFVNPPYFAIVALPLAYLPVDVGFIIWGLGQLLVLLVAIRLLQTLLPISHRYLLWLGAFAYLPVYQSLTQAQVSPTLLLGLVLFWRCLRDEEHWAAGASLALLLLKPQLLPLFLLYLIYRRCWQALAGFSIVTLLVYLAAALTSGWGWPQAYLNLLGFLSTHPGRYGSAPELMFTWRGLLARVGLNSMLLLVLLTMITAAALVYAWWQSDRPPAVATAARVGRRELQLAATTLAASLVAFYLYTHDLVILLFSGAVLLGWAAEHRWPRGLTVLLISALLLPFSFFSNVRDTIALPLDASFILLVSVALAASLWLLNQTEASVNNRGYEGTT